MKKSRQFVESLARGIGLLDILCKSPSPLGLSELAKQRDLSVSMVQRISYTLQQLGLIGRDLDTKKFQIGPHMITLALAVIENLEVKKVAFPIMEQLSREINEMVGLGALFGNNIFLIERVIKMQQILNINLKPGDLLPFNATAAGKVILAFLPESEADKILKKTRLKKIAVNTITSIRSFKNQMKNVRKCGFATAIDEGANGFSTIAAPVRNNHGNVIASLIIMVPTARAMGDSLIVSFKDKLIQNAAQISYAIGYRGDMNR